MLLWTGCSSLYGRRGSARECCWFVRAGLLKTRSRSPGRFCFWREKQVPRPARADTRFPDSTQPWTVVGVTAPFIPTRSGRRVDRRRSTLRGAQGSDLGLHPNSAVFGRASSLPVRWLVLVVISQACHFPEVAQENAGIVCELNAAKVAAGLQAILADPIASRQMGQRGRELVVSRYTWPAVAKQMVAAYERAVAI